MEISKDNMFKVEYTSVLGENIAKKKKRTSRVFKFIKKNKIISIAAVIFVVCVSFNCVLIYNFIKILESAQ